jgi:hypothetical protein
VADCRVARLQPDYGETSDASKAVLFRSLASNRGLVDLDLQQNAISNDNWTILCESLQAHPTLTSLDLWSTRPRRPTGASIAVVDEQKAHRTRLLAEMMEQNTILQTIGLSRNERDEQIYTESILPCLGMNIYRARVLAINKADISLRRPLLGQALQTKSVRNNSNLLWMFL